MGHGQHVWAHQVILSIFKGIGTIELNDFIKKFDNWCDMQHISNLSFFTPSMAWKGLFQLVHDYHEFRCAHWECDILYPHFYLLLNMYYSTTFLRTLHTKIQFNINEFGYDFDHFRKKIYPFYMYFFLNIIMILEKKNCNFFL